LPRRARRSAGHHPHPHLALKLCDYIVPEFARPSFDNARDDRNSVSDRIVEIDCALKRKQLKEALAHANHADVNLRVLSRCRSALPYSIANCCKSDQVFLGGDRLVFLKASDFDELV
jgi:hypothetical protein